MRKTLLWVACLTIFIAGCTRKESSVIRIKGSDTEVNLVQRLAEGFMEKNPKLSIAVTGGGSGVGISALINSETDIANSSRLMKEEELKKAKENGINPIATVFGLDRLAIIINSSLMIGSLTIETLGKIYRGEITNYKELGGADLAIILYGRTSASGTYLYFRETAVKGDYSPNMKQMIGTSQIVEAVKRDPGGIGYVGIGYLKSAEGIKEIKIAKDKDSPYISPLEKGYPLERKLYQYTNGEPSSNIASFISFELSEEGQRIVAEEGFYPVQ
ncbi:MAG: PstS family phosphate ABC transporter substrate-binding protein [bacterium]|nr:PstS family phosphate ABC transporter substrate-binding protein [bacterium]